MSFIPSTGTDLLWSQYHAVFVTMALSHGLRAGIVIVIVSAQYCSCYSRCLVFHINFRIVSLVMGGMSMQS